MQALKKKLCRLAGGSLLSAAILLAAAAAMALLGAKELTRSYDAFDPFGSAGAHGELVVTYVMGPFAAQTKGERTSDEYYIAADAEEYWYLVDLEPNHKIPVYGEDVGDADLADLPGIHLRGTAKSVPYELAAYLAEFVGDPVTAYNYDGYFGGLYLDCTRAAAGGDAMFFFLMAGVFALVGVLLLVPTLRRQAKMKAALDEMEQSGQLEPLYEDFAAGVPLYSAPLKLAVGTRYLLDCSTPAEGPKVLRLADYTNAYRCNMRNGEPTTTYYVALESAGGSRTGVGACRGGRRYAEAAAAKIRAGLRTREVPAL